MKEVIEFLELLLEDVATIAIVLFEMIGVCVIVWCGFKSFVKWVKHAGDTRIYLARGLALGLEFKMGSEILRTVIVREWREIGIVAGIIVLRAALNFLIHWEIKEEERTSAEEIADGQ